MNPELQKLREHWETLPPHVKSRATAASLIRAIQIAEKLEQKVADLYTVEEVVWACGGTVSDVVKNLIASRQAIEAAIVREAQKEGK